MWLGWVAVPHLRMILAAFAGDPGARAAIRAKTTTVTSFLHIIPSALWEKALISAAPT
jgi:hypothetical protein